MSLLIITHKDNSAFRLPYHIILNGSFLGTMTTPQARLRLPPGCYTLTIRCGGFLPIGKKGKSLDLTLSTTESISVSESGYTCIEFKNKERWWDILFTIDLVVWFISLFLTLPHPWNIIYHVISDGFFLLWLIHLIVVRKRYFSFYTTYSDTPPKEIPPE